MNRTHYYLKINNWVVFLQFEGEAHAALPREGVRPLRGATQAP